MAVRKIVLIGGSGHSGTTMVAKTLDALGVQFPKWKGFGELHEDIDIDNLNHRIIQTAGGEDWRTPHVDMVGNHLWVSTEEMGPLVEEAREMMWSISDLPLCGIKDPKFSLTWPLWWQAAGGMGGEVDWRFVLCLRHPENVDMPLLSWEKYTVAAMHHWPRPCIMHYNSVLLHPEKWVQRLLTHLDLDEIPVEVFMDGVAEILPNRRTKDRKMCRHLLYELLRTESYDGVYFDGDARPTH